MKIKAYVVTLGDTQYDKIGRFFELLDDQFSYNSCPNTRYLKFWAILNDTTFMFKMI